MPADREDVAPAASDAPWADEPAPLAGAGGPVLYEGDKLLQALRSQL